jgi:hypothetical protein
MGPGIGESIVLQLPCGGWGVVDCYHTEKGGTTEFLQKKRVKRLKFICFTHPHEDHYRGAHRLFRRYAGKIDRIWRFPGFSTKDFINLGLATRVRAKYLGDPEAASLYDDYLLLIKNLARERKRLGDEYYRLIIGSYPLLLHERYRIHALAPGSTAVEHFLQRFARIVIRTGPMLLNEEGGELINSMSVVLTIAFGSSTVFLLGDAQGPSIALGTQRHGYSVVKIAHHGSINGYGADVLTMKSRRPRIDHGVVTPYSRSGLPTAEMTRTYRGACAKLVHTCPTLHSSPQQAVPGLNNARLPNKSVTWIGIEVTSDGTVRQFQ